MEHKMGNEFFDFIVVHADSNSCPCSKTGHAKEENYHAAIKPNGELVQGNLNVKDFNPAMGRYNTFDIMLLANEPQDVYSDLLCTKEQWKTLGIAIEELLDLNPNALVCGHADFMEIYIEENGTIEYDNSTFLEECPKFDVMYWWYGKKPIGTWDDNYETLNIVWPNEEEN